MKSDWQQRAPASFSKLQYGGHDCCSAEQYLMDALLVMAVVVLQGAAFLVHLRLLFSPLVSSCCFVYLVL